MRNGNKEYRWLLQNAAPRTIRKTEIAGYIGSLLDITESKILQIKVEKSLREKEILLKEIHHRVKNNLQIVSSLLNLQSYYIKDKNLSNVFKSSQDRLRIMSLLHEKLYRSDDISVINLKIYLNDVIQYLINSYEQFNSIKLDIKIEEIIVDVSLAIHSGLILNELILNAVKHAFKGRDKGNISIELNSAENKMVKIKVSNDGDGLPKGFRLQNNKSFGLELINALVNQRDGRFEFRRNKRTEFIVHLKKYENEK
jgi:two-component sensor histidine kinase